MYRPNKRSHGPATQAGGPLAAGLLPASSKPKINVASVVHLSYYAVVALAVVVQQGEQASRTEYPIPALLPGPHLSKEMVVSNLKFVKDVRKLVEKLPGFSIGRLEEGKHVKMHLSTPTGPQVMIISRSASDWRVMMKIEKQLRKWK